MVLICGEYKIFSAIFLSSLEDFSISFYLNPKIFFNHKIMHKNLKRISQENVYIRSLFSENSGRYSWPLSSS